MPEPLYQSIREHIRREIESRRYAPGERLPSDSELGAKLDASRLTVIRALRELQAEGLVQRRAGSGTWVCDRNGAATLTFGLLMPDLGDGEVFEPIARGIARAVEPLHHRLLWGTAPASSENKERQALDLCRYFIERKVSGVFFAPVELTSHQDDVNHRIAGDLEANGIPVVLIDRCIARFPARSRHDLVGIDNNRAGCRMATHLLDAGCKRLAFAFRRGSAPTVDARFAGYREALWNRGLEPLPFSGPTTLVDFLKTSKPDGFLCANDLTAANIMHALLKLGRGVPEHIRMAGINDVKYASFLPVPLTTLRQPCHEIGSAALSVMLDRLAHPDTPARDVLLDCELIVRQSCGT